MSPPLNTDDVKHLSDLNLSLIYVCEHYNDDDPFSHFSSFIRHVGIKATHKMMGHIVVASLLMSLSMSPNSGVKQPKGTMVAIQALRFKPLSVPILNFNH